MLVELLGCDLALGFELGDDDVLMLEELVKCGGCVFGPQDGRGVGAGEGLEVGEEGFVHDVDV